MIRYHQDLAKSGRWFAMTLQDQLGNTGSEVSRAQRWQSSNDERFQKAVERCYELFELTLSDPRWKGRRKEITRARELFGDAVLGGREYGTTLKDLDRYFMVYALQARGEVLAARRMTAGAHGESV